MARKHPEIILILSGLPYNTHLSMLCKKECFMAKKKTSKKKTSKKKSSKKTSKKKPGLYANIHKAQERAKRGGRPVRKKGQKGAPKEKAFRKAKKTAKKK